FEIGDADRFAQVAEGVLDDDPVLLPAEDQADRRLVGRRLAQEVIHRREIEIHLAGKLRLKRPHLEIDNDVAMKPAVVEEQIDEELVPPDLQSVLLTEKRESHPEFQQELPEMV